MFAVLSLCSVLMSEKALFFVMFDQYMYVQIHVLFGKICYHHYGFCALRALICLCFYDTSIGGNVSGTVTNVVTS